MNIHGFNLKWVQNIFMSFPKVVLFQSFFKLFYQSLLFLLVSISSTFYKQILQVQILTAQKKTDNLTVCLFLRFWDLQNLPVKRWWNWPNVSYLSNSPLKQMPLQIKQRNLKKFQTCKTTIVTCSPISKRKMTFLSGHIVNILKYLEEEKIKLKLTISRLWIFCWKCCPVAVQRFWEVLARILFGLVEDLSLICPIRKLESLGLDKLVRAFRMLSLIAFIFTQSLSRYLINLIRLCLLFQSYSMSNCL